MKTAIIVFILLAFVEKVDTPDGIWVYKQDSSRIEINEFAGKLSGKLISTRNPNSKPGTLILENFIFIEGKWQGRLFLTSKDRWVEANLEQNGDLIFIEMDMGYEIRRIHLYRGK